MIDTVHNWCTKWHLKVNSSKSQVIRFRPQCITKIAYDFKFGGVSLSVVPHYKYLGVILDEHLQSCTNARTLAAAGRRALGKIYAVHKKLYGLGYSPFTQLYQSYVDPILTYASGVWGKKKSFPDAIQNRAIRIFLGSTDLLLSWPLMAGWAGDPPIPNDVFICYAYGINYAAWIMIGSTRKFSIGIMIFTNITGPATLKTFSCLEMEYIFESKIPIDIALLN